MSRYDLNLPQDFSENTKYNQSTDPTVSNEFATVAFRFGHSLIPSILIPSSQPIRKGSISCSLRENFFKFDQFVLGADMSGNEWKNMLFGLQYQQSPAMDASMSNSVILQGQIQNSWRFWTRSCRKKYPTSKRPWVTRIHRI